MLGKWRLIAAETFVGGVDMDPVGLAPVRTRAIPRVPRGVISALRPSGVGKLSTLPRILRPLDGVNQSWLCS